MEGAPEFQEWWVCVNNRGVEVPRWDIDKCTVPKKRNMYNVNCTMSWNETALEFMPNCTLSVLKHKTEVPLISNCTNVTSYLNEFNEQVYDLRCIDPYYAILIEDRYEPNAPPALRIVFQIVGAFFELHIVTMAIAPWYVLLLVYMLMDFIIDWIWYAIFFAYCLPCAWTFIWIFNVVFIPFATWGMIFRGQLELIGFLFDWWLLIFRGDGCIMRWGNNCWMARRIPQRDHMTWTDVTALNKAGAHSANFAAWFSGDGTNQMLDWIEAKYLAAKNLTDVNNIQGEFLSGDIFAVGR